MLIPVKCFTCNFPISTKYEKYLELKEKLPPNELFKAIKVRRYCCKKILISHVDVIDKIVERKEEER